MLLMMTRLLQAMVVVQWCLHPWAVSHPCTTCNTPQQGSLQTSSWASSSHTRRWEGPTGRLGVWRKNRDVDGVAAGGCAVFQRVCSPVCLHASCWPKEIGVHTSVLSCQALTLIVPQVTHFTLTPYVLALHISWCDKVLR